MTLTPAYGRDYKSKKEVLADWNSNKDFIVSDMFSGCDGQLINRQDAPTGSYNIRYKKLAQVLVVKHVREES